MTDKIRITIDGKEFEMAADRTILEAARERDIHIPTLCYHPALEPTGACRFCLVEVKTPRGWKLQPACYYPVSDGLEVRTESDEVSASRRGVVEMLLARCPNVDELKKIAGEAVPDKVRFEAADPAERCILCGLCERVCSELIGASAISIVARGSDSRVSPPFEIESAACIGCATCVYICPTNAISIEHIEPKKGAHRLSDENAGPPCAACAKEAAHGRGGEKK